MYAGHSVVFRCTSTGGNPAPNVTWYRDAVPLSQTASTTLTPPSVKYGSTVASLTWTLSADDHLVSFSCSARTDDIPGSLVFSAVRQYRVQCKSVGPTTLCLKKRHPFYFCDIFVKFHPILLIFGRNMPEEI